MARRILIVALVAMATLLLGSTALAHEKRTVGAYTVVVGFKDEPTYVGQPNGALIRVTDSSGKPVTGLEDTLRCEVTAQGRSRTFKLVASDEEPGAYTADFVPGRTGTYVFRFFGTIGSQRVDERFASGPNTFDEPQDPLVFPPAADPLADVRASAQLAFALSLAAIVLAVAVPLGLRRFGRRPS